MKINRIISLGINCFTRTILTRWKIKATKEQGELTCPFDLCVCPLNSVYTLLKNNFSNFYDSIFYDDNEKVYKNENLKIIFNHDKDLTSHDYELFYDRYKRRIENFYTLLNSNTKKYFILTTINDASNPAVVDSISKIITQYGSFLWIHIGKQDIQAGLTYNFPHFHIKNPYPNYWGEWYKKEFFNSPEGKQFEQDYIKCVTKFFTV